MAQTKSNIKKSGGYLPYFKEIALSIHGDKFDYGKVVFTKNLKDKVEIGCNTCGNWFLQRAQYHLNGGGCGYCSGRLENLDTVLKKIHKKFGENRFTCLSNKEDYLGTQCSLRFKCNVCETVFEKIVGSMVNNKTDCPTCSLKNKRLAKMSFDFGKTSVENYYRERGRAIHGDNIDYSKVVTVRNVKEKVILICKIHGEFIQRLDCSLRGRGCPECNRSFKISKAEDEVADFMSSLGFSIQRNVPVLGRKHIDIFVPDKGIGFEYNGLHWHRDDEEGLLNKTILAEGKGIHLAHIFEDEWIFKQGITKKYIKDLLDESHPVLPKNIRIEEVSSSQAIEFLSNTHLEGFDPLSDLSLGLFDEGNLVYMMSFKFLGNYYEISRHSSLHNAIEGFSEVLGYFKASYRPTRIVSYVDRRWSYGREFLENGFRLVDTTRPNYFWCKSQRRFDRSNFRQILKVFNESLTEVENCKANGFDQVFDCGQLKFELTLQ